MYSALKRGGVPLYRLARSGIEVERSPRRVRIEELTIERYAWPELDLHVRCSKGTYVRTLVEDIARAAGTVGHVGALRRLTVSPFAAEGMRTFEELEAAAADGAAALDRLLLPAEAALEGFSSAYLGAGRGGQARARSGGACGSGSAVRPCEGLCGFGTAHRHWPRDARASPYAPASLYSLTAWSGTEYFGMMRGFQEKH